MCSGLSKVSILASELAPTSDTSSARVKNLSTSSEMKESTRGVILGQGHLDCAAVFDAMIQAKFPADGALSLEYEENPKDPIEDIRQCVATAKSAMTKAKG